MPTACSPLDDDAADPERIMLVAGSDLHAVVAVLLDPVVGEHGVGAAALEVLRVRAVVDVAAAHGQASGVDVMVVRRISCGARRLAVVGRLAAFDERENFCVIFQLPVPSDAAEITTARPQERNQSLDLI